MHLEARSIGHKLSKLDFRTKKKRAEETQIRHFDGPRQLEWEARCYGVCRVIRTPASDAKNVPVLA